MVGIIIVTHGQLGRELIKAVEMIIGPQKQLVSVEIEHQNDMPSSAENIEKAFEQVNKGKGVIIFTDLLGGTPSNVSLTLLNKPDVEVISGVNLPMLIKASNLRSSESIRSVVDKARKSGCEGITVATEILGKTKR